MANKEKKGLYSMRDLMNFKMNEIQRAKTVLKILNQTYPKIKVPLKSRNVFTLDDFCSSFSSMY